ncbi:hypothetical protein HHI36_009367 [Cryptolaemus montrouzieri]|uniref:uDENN domain-containing protein n=1 Tax=Cryptolaemus montrouzieri TaxID=559131 RepID=A0ABD2MVA1_9CUCU
MYKPPENTNRVKSIKSKFENIEKSNDVKEGRNIFKNGTRDNLNMPTNYLEKQECSVSRLNLERQLSDPSKRNIKRTPAFRLDKNTEKVALQRGSVINKSQEFKHILKPINVPKANNCDITPITSESNVNTKVPFITKNNKPILYKSKSSIDFNLIRNKFNSENINNNTVKEPNQRNEECRMKNISALYTEPIPKSLRNKTCDKTIPKPIYSNLDELSDEMKNLNGIENNNIHMCSTLKLTERKKNNNSQNSMTNVTTDKLYGGIPNGKKNLVECNNSDSNSALKKLDHLLELTKLNSLQKTKSERQVGLSLELTDTLKNALKKPLPTGPAPKKPPRTFTHCFKHEPTEAHINNSEKNVSFLHISKNQDSETEKPLCLREKVNLKRNDPKYMLNKLETALRNNKLRYKRNIKTDVSTTSGEDSDDNIVKSISNVEAVKQNHVLVPDNFSKSNNSSPSNNMFVQALNLNCLNSHTCLSPPYSKLNESKSSFFISKKNEEPVYAEPWHFEDLKVKNTPRARSVSSDRNSRNKRNSLYYLSSPVSCSTPRSNNPNAMNNSTNQTDVPSSTQKCRSEKSPSPEVSSLSSFTSDSAASTPMDDTEKSLLASIKIKELIDVFENNTITEVDQTMTNDRDTIDTSFEANDSGGGEERKDESERTSMTPDRKLSAEDPTVSKFRSYIKNVSVYSKTRPSKKKSTLFECCLIVEWNADVRRIKFKFPHTVKTPHKIEDLCFPDAACGPLDKTLNAQCYSLVITDDKGERTFGYCRRVVPEGSNKCLPIAYCILSKHKSPRFYRKILIELESRHGISEFHRDNLLRAFYFNTFPEPGETITIKLTDTIACGRNKENYTNVKEESEKKRNS